MKKLEALQAMKDGKLISHIHYDDSEYLYMKDGIIYNQDNVPKGSEDDLFWKKVQSWEFHWLLKAKVKQIVFNETAQEKLNYIISANFIRNFPTEKPTQSWVGAVLDFLEETELMKK